METDLLQYADQGGCSSKIPPKQLEEVLKHLPLPEDPDILVSIDTHDDAGVYRVNDDLALVLTTDFFPPVCSDPYEFGEIAASNSISDVYAMGGDPVLALNIMMFPASKIAVEAYSAILRGGFDKASEAGVKIIGGHTIDDETPKYGLAVIGYVHPGKIITNAGARPGDVVILTKPLGSGIIMAGHRLGLASDKDLNDTKRVMKLLNKSGSDIMKKYNIRGATDITGFGLAGHALKMAKASNVSIEMDLSRIPVIGDTWYLVEKGCIPGACFTNLEYCEDGLSVAPKLDYSLKMIAFDAQTSGGLLISAPEVLAGDLISDLRSSGLNDSAIIGVVTSRKEKFIYLKNKR